MNDTLQQPMKRKLLALLCSLPWLSACRAGPDHYHTGDPAEDALRQRFRDLSIVLVVDAVEGVEMAGVQFFSDNGFQIFGSATVALHKRSIMSVGSARVPRWVRVIWRKDDEDFKVISSGAGIEYKGTIAGDYTLPVADRIPDAVLESLRKDPKGNLRIKFRLHPEGVYFGWDIERAADYDLEKQRKEKLGYPYPYHMPGGDFQGAIIVSGKTARKGWYIDKNGQKIETDH